MANDATDPGEQPEQQPSRDILSDPRQTVAFILDRLLTFLKHAVPHNPADPAAAQALSDLHRLRDTMKGDGE